MAVCLIAFSPGLVVVGIKAVVGTFDLIRMTPGQDGGVLLIAVSLCPVALGIACAMSGLDLWRLKQRGRAPAIFLLCLFALFGADLVLIDSVDKIGTSRVELGVGAGSCVFCLWGIVYLCLPRIRRILRSSGRAGSFE